MKKMLRVLIFSIILSALSPVYAANISAYRLTVPTASTTEISLKTALHKILENNLTAGILRYEDQQADSLYERYQTKFSPFISASLGSTKTELDPASLDAIYGAKFNKEESSLNLGKSFKTGTTVVGGYKDTHTDYIEPSAYLTGRLTDWHSSAVYLQVKQDLLKNSFGYTDRLQDEILQNVRDSKQAAAEYQLSGLVVSGIFDYWSVAEKQKKLSAAEAELAAYQKIHEAIEKNVEIGLYEKYNLYQFDALISGSEAKLAGAQLQYQKAVHKMLRDLNMQEVSGNELSLVSMDEAIHQFDTVALYKKALEQRADIRQARMALESAEKQLKILGSQSLPDAQFQWQGTGLGYEEKQAAANKEAGKLEYTNWEAKITVSKVLFDNDNSIQKRNAEFQIEQAKLQLRNLDHQAKDEVRDGVAAVQTAYVSVQKTKAMVEDSKKYLDALLIRLRQGKISTMELKGAVDMQVAANNAYADAVTGYNMALLNIDLVTNTVFEKYDLDISAAVKETK